MENDFMHKTLKSIQAELLQGTPISGGHLHELAALFPECLLDLMAVARLQASQFSGRPFTCGIINAKSGNCTEDCSFCAQSQYHATHTPVYRRVSMDILKKRADELSAIGAAYMGIVISGKSPAPGDLDFFCEAG